VVTSNSRRVYSADSSRGSAAAGFFFFAASVVACCMIVARRRGTGTAGRFTLALFAAALLLFAAPPTSRVRAAGVIAGLSSNVKCRRTEGTRGLWAPPPTKLAETALIALL